MIKNRSNNKKNKNNNMKNKSIFIAIFFMIGIGSVNAQVLDTLSYVRSIVANKNKYIGKTFNDLEKDLKIEIKSFFPSPYIGKNSQEENTVFYFIRPIEIEDFDSPSIAIDWESYLDIRISKRILYNLRSNSNIESWWNPESKNFYKNAVIKDIFIFGEGKKTYEE